MTAIESDPTGRPARLPQQDELNLLVGDKLDDLFDAVESRFVRLSRYERANGVVEMKPSEVKAMLRTWDLDDAYEDWWHDGKTDEDLAEEPWS
jgi:hypothetical protein